MLSQFFSSLTWHGLLIGILVFVVTFAINVGIVSFILVKLPHNYFSNSYQTSFLSGRHPALHAAGIIGKNILGVLLVAIGILMSIPGVPGQGLLTILMGIMLLNFPGKRRLEQKLLSRRGVLKAINRLRLKFDKPALIVD